MLTSNAYYWMKSVLDNETCDKIINLGLSKVPKTASTRGNKQKTSEKSISQEDKTLEDIGYSDHIFDIGEKKEYHIRVSEVSWLNDKWMYDIFHPYVHHANKQAGWNWQWDFSESFQFTVYHGRKENGGFYGWHADGSSDHLSIYKAAIKVKDKPIQFKPPKRDNKGFVVMRPDGKPEPDMRAADIPLKRDKKTLAPGYTDNIHMWDKVRKISMTVNLTKPENYAGGNLKFDLGAHAGKKRFKVCEEIRPTGSIIIFPSFTYHCVTPVTRGTRYSLVLWSLGKPWR